MSVKKQKPKKIWPAILELEHFGSVLIPRSKILIGLVKKRQLRKAANYLFTCLNMVLKPNLVYSHPVTVVIDTGNICNLRCALCITGRRKSRRPPKLLSFSDFKKIIDQAGKWAIQLDLYNWGEPLMNRDFFKMITYAKNKWHLRVETSSNLLLLTPETAKKLIKSGLDRLIVSLHGASPKTTRIYMKGGDFNKAIRNLKLLINLKQQLKSKTPSITWRYVVNSYNESGLAKAAQLAKKLAVDYFEPLPVRLDVGHNPEEIKTVIKKKGHWIPNDPKYQLYDVFGGKMINIIPDCFWPWEITAVNSDGSIQPCCVYSNPVFDFGNILETPFWKIWNNSNYQLARKVIRKKIKTDHRTICGQCVACFFIHQ